MIVTKLAIVVGIALFGLLCWMAVDGITPAAVLLITVGALVVLVGGGNWIGGRSTHSRGQPPAGPAPSSGTAPPGEGQAPPA